MLEGGANNEVNVGKMSGLDVVSMLPIWERWGARWIPATARGALRAGPGKSAYLGAGAAVRRARRRWIEGLDGEFDEEKRLGDEVVAAAHGGVGAALEISEAGDEDDRGLFVTVETAQLGAEFKSVHARHIDVQEDEVEIFFGKEVEGGLGIFEVGGLQFGLFEGVGDGAAGNSFIINDQNMGLGRGSGLGFAGFGAVESIPRKSMARATVRSVEAVMVLGFS